MFNSRFQWQTVLDNFQLACETNKYAINFFAIEYLGRWIIISLPLRSFNDSFRREVIDNDGWCAVSRNTFPIMQFLGFSIALLFCFWNENTSENKSFAFRMTSHVEKLLWIFVGRCRFNLLPKLSIKQWKCYSTPCLVCWQKTRFLHITAPRRKVSKFI